MQGSLKKHFSINYINQTTITFIRAFLLFIGFSLGLVACGGGNSGGLPASAQPDKIGPIVQKITPALNEIDVPISQLQIEVTFDEPLDDINYLTSNVIIEELNGSGETIPNSQIALHAASPFSFRENVLIIKLATNSVKEQKQYQIKILDFVDKDGNVMAVYTSRFSTTKQPKVSKISPLNNAIPVSLAKKIVIEFDEVMDELSLKDGFTLSETLPNSTISTVYKFEMTSSPLKLEHQIINNKSIASYTMIDPSTKKTKLFAQTTLYSINLASIATDLKGNKVIPFSSVFTTGVNDQVGAAPAAPTSITVSASNNGLIFNSIVTWSIIPNTAYNLYVSKNGTTFLPLATSVVPSLQELNNLEISFTDKNVTVGDQYIYAVSAMEIIATTTYGPESTFKKSDIIIPSIPAPTNISAIAGPNKLISGVLISDGTVELTWDTITNNNYNLYVSVNNGEFLILKANVAASGMQLTYSYTPVVDNFYRYGVTLVNFNGKESIMTLGNSVIPFTAPTEVTVLAWNKKVTVTWPIWKNVPNLSYEVFAKNNASASNFTSIASGLTLGQFIHGSGAVGSNNPPLTNGVSYTYKIVAISTGTTITRVSNLSVASLTVVPLFPPTPKKLNALAGDASVLLSWSVEPGSNYSYRIYEKIANAATFNLIDTLVTPSVGSIRILVPNNISHSYQITAFDLNDESPPAITQAVIPKSRGTQLSAWDHSCAVLDGAIWCWGDNSYGQLGIGTISRAEKQKLQVLSPTLNSTFWLQVVTGEKHTCGLTNTGAMYCWGYGVDGQLGDGAKTSRSKPVLVNKPIILGGVTAKWLQIDAGQNHTCGIIKSATNIGQLFCWGDDSKNQLGIAQQTPKVLSVAQPEPVLYGLDTNDNWIEIRTGYSHNCGIREQAGGESSLWCWGERLVGKTGDNPDDITTTTLFEPTKVVSMAGAVDTDWSSIALGKSHTCGVKGITKELWCWGSNVTGQIGNPASNSTAYQPIQEFSLAQDWIKVFANNNKTCGLKKSGSINCWGENLSGELGNGKLKKSETTPFNIPGSTNWTAIAIGSSHICSSDLTINYIGGTLKRLNTVSCWGSLNKYAIGSAKSESNVPVLIKSTEDKWLDINLGGFNINSGFTIATLDAVSSNVIFAWGANEKGYLQVAGANRLENEQLPQIVLNSTTFWKQISAGARYSCGIQSNNSLWCWGLGSFALTGININIPLTQFGAEAWLSVSSNTHSCAIKLIDNSLWCWGPPGFDGELGAGVDPVTLDPIVPPSNEMIQVVKPTPNTTWKMVSAGYHYTCAIDNLDDLYCWGANFNGTLGIGTETIPFDNNDKFSPVLVTKPVGVSSWLKVSTGKYTTCALTDNGNQNLYCWGSNKFGAVGSSTVGDANQLTPKLVALTANTVADQTPWVDINIYAEHVCSRKNDSPNGIAVEGSLWCWGKNDVGQIGNGQFNVKQPAKQVVPSQVEIGSYWKKFATGYNYTCGIKSDDTLWCWGINFSGQLGTNNAWNIVPLALTFGAGNQPPEDWSYNYYTVQRGVSTTLNFKYIDPDNGPHPLIYEIVVYPNTGILKFNSTKTALIYTPDLDSPLFETFEIRAFDGMAYSIRESSTIEISP